MECYLKKNNLGCLKDYIKHTKDWSVLDGVLSFDFNKKEITCFATVDAESVFYESEYDGIYSYTGFEFIAQTCGVYYGLEARLIHKRPPRFGFILRVLFLKKIILPLSVCTPFDCPVSIPQLRIVSATFFENLSNPFE